MSEPLIIQRNASADGTYRHVYLSTGTSHTLHVPTGRVTSCRSRHVEHPTADGYTLMGTVSDIVSPMPVEVFRMLWDQAVDIPHVEPGPMELRLLAETP